MTTVNDTVEISATFNDPTGLLADPTALTLVVTDPTGSPTTYNWPSPATITRDNLGTFHLDLTVDVAGLWRYVWTATGAVIATIRSAIQVDPLSETLNVTVEDQTATPVAGVEVLVIVEPNTVFPLGVTDGSGVASGSVPPGEYDIELQLPKTAFSNPYAVSVADTGGITPTDITCTCQTLSIPETAAAQRVRLFGHAIGESGLAAMGMRVQVETVGYGSQKSFLQGASGSDTGVNPISLMVKPEKRDLHTDANGYWECDIVAGSTVRVEIPAARFSVIFRVPNDPLITTLNIRDARPDPGPGKAIGIDSDTSGRDDLEGLG